MQRMNQFVFIITLLALCWFLMMTLHELGHVIGARLTGGTVQRVILYPLAISRTDVSPNLNPLAVVWLGPILGSLIPIIIPWFVPNRYAALQDMVWFFAGFCLIANGAYISFGAFDRVGDCDVMLLHGSPLWVLLAYGGVSLAIGMFVWHRLGSIQLFLREPSLIDPVYTYAIVVTLVAYLVAGFTVSPR